MATIRPGGTTFNRSPAADSPARGTAEGNFPQVKADMDGQPRGGKLDSGSDQISDARVNRRPLTASDVGPAWRQDRERALRR